MSDKSDALMRERIESFKANEKANGRSAAIRQMACQMSLMWEEKYGPAGLEVGHDCNGKSLARVDQIVRRCATIYDQVQAAEIPGE